MAYLTQNAINITGSQSMDSSSQGSFANNICRAAHLKTDSLEVARRCGSLEGARRTEGWNSSISRSGSKCLPSEMEPRAVPSRLCPEVEKVDPCGRERGAVSSVGDTSDCSSDDFFSRNISPKLAFNRMPELTRHEMHGPMAVTPGSCSGRVSGNQSRCVLKRNFQPNRPTAACPGDSTETLVADTEPPERERTRLEKKCFCCNNVCCGDCKCRLPLKRFYCMYKNAIGCDLTLNLRNGGSYNIHKQVLAFHSQRFLNALRNGVVPLDKHINITVIDTYEVILKSVVKYLYTCKICVTDDNLEGYIGVAKQLHLTRLLTMNEDHLTKDVEPNNVIGKVMIAERHHLDSAHDYLNHYVLNNFSKVVRYLPFFNLRADQVCKYLCHDDLLVESEMDVFSVAMAWVYYLPSTRMKIAHEVLQCVRFSLFPVTVLMTQVEPLVEKLNNVKAIALVYRAYRIHAIEASGSKPVPYCRPVQRLSSCCYTKTERPGQACGSGSIGAFRSNFDRIESSSSNDDCGQRGNSNSNMAAGRVSYFKDACPPLSVGNNPACVKFCGSGTVPLEHRLDSSQTSFLKQTSKEKERRSPTPPGQRSCLAVRKNTSPELKFGNDPTSYKQIGFCNKPKKKIAVFADQLHGQDQPCCCTQDPDQIGFCQLKKKTAVFADHVTKEASCKPDMDQIRVEANYDRADTFHISPPVVPVGTCVCSPICCQPNSKTICCGNTTSVCCRPSQLGICERPPGRKVGHRSNPDLNNQRRTKMVCDRRTRNKSPDRFDSPKTITAYRGMNFTDVACPSRVDLSQQCSQSTIRIQPRSPQDHCNKPKSKKRRKFRLFRLHSGASSPKVTVIKTDSQISEHFLKSLQKQLAELPSSLNLNCAPVKEAFDCPSESREGLGPPRGWKKPSPSPCSGSNISIGKKIKQVSWHHKLDDPGFQAPTGVQKKKKRRRLVFCPDVIHQSTDSISIKCEPVCPIDDSYAHYDINNLLRRMAASANKLKDNLDARMCSSKESCDSDQSGSSYRTTNSCLSPKQQLRKATERFIYVVGGNSYSAPCQETGKKFLKFSLTCGAWCDMPDLPVSRFRHATVLDKVHLYVIGGAAPDREDRPCNTLFTFNICENKWMSCHPMCEKRMLFSACMVCDGIILVTGGMSVCFQMLCSTEWFDVSTGQWRPGPCLRKPRAAHGCAVFCRKVFIAGGYMINEKTNCLEILSTVEALDLRSDFNCNCWQCYSDMPLPTCFPELAVACNTLYLLGGATEFKTECGDFGPASFLSGYCIFSYDTGCDRWTRVAEFQQPRHDGASVVVADKLIYYLGGISTGQCFENYISTVECFDASCHKVELVSSFCLPSSTFSFGAVS